MEFLCDDAFITFRCVANAHDGHGLVWNPPPFAPVEGYTSFLWALLLWAVWEVTGLEPPQTANALALACSLLSLGVLARCLLRVVTAARAHWVWLGLLAIASNRTFVSWCSSGLETALFQLLFVGWILHACSPASSSLRWWSRWSALAALLALTRPDGLLCCAASFAVALVFGASGRLPWRTLGLGLLPLTIVGVHLLWRNATYGAWLPNTYYAKVVEAWPAAGLTYFACFAVEHGTWLWLPIAGGAIARTGLRRVAQAALARPTTSAAVLTLLAHFAYYTLVVGGDHFDFRVYTHLVPLSIASAVWWVARQPVSRWRTLATSAFLVASGLGWVHLLWTNELGARGFVPIADRLPAVLQPCAREYDRWQAWLRIRLIGLRCSEHRAFLVRQQQVYPERARRSLAGTDDLPVHAAWAIGVAGWALPDVAILDQYGLCDRIVARTVPPPRRPALGERQRECMFRVADVDRDGLLSPGELATVVQKCAGASMAGRHDRLVDLVLALGRDAAPSLDRAQFATVWPRFGDGRCIAHERRPPPGYVEALRPNVEVLDGSIVVRPRRKPLGASEVLAIEASWWRLVHAAAGRR